MKLNNENLFITDNDIMVTNSQEFGNTLGTVIEKHSADINNLKSNVKWIYQNGGVGGHGTGTGTDSSSGNKLRITASIGGQTMSNNTQISLDGEQMYALSIGAENHNGAEIRVLVTYTTSKGENSFVEFLDYKTNGCLITKKIKLDINTTINITATGPDSTKMLSAPIILNPYKIECYLAKNDGSKWETEDGDISIEQAISQGLFVNIVYDIAVSGSFKYKCQNFDGIQGDEENMLVGAGIQRIVINPTVQQMSNALAGLHSFIVDFTIKPDNGLTVTRQEILTCNLIPDDLYLKLMPATAGAQLYNNIGTDKFTFDDIKGDNLDENTLSTLTEISNNRYNFKEGNISLKIQGYYGPNNGRRFDINVFIDDVKIETDYLTIIECTPYNITIPTGLPSVKPHKLAISITSGKQVGTFVYYYYVTKPESSISWYEKQFESFVDAQNNNVYYNFFRGKGNDTNIPNERKYTNAFVDFKDLQQIEKNTNDTATTIYSANVAKEFQKPNKADDILISLGIQYSSINDVSKEIVTIGSNDESLEHAFFHIYQNKITIGTSSNSVEIFLPKEKNYNKNVYNQYHLLNIVKRFIGNNSYEISVYIDGKLEAEFSNFQNIQTLFNKIVLHPANYSLNLIELSYFEHNKGTSNVRKAELNPNTGKTEITPLKFMDESNIVRYWYYYCLNLGNEDLYDPIKVELLDSYKMFESNNTSGFNMVEVPTEALIKDIAQKSTIPTLLFKYTDTITDIINNKGFLTWLNTQYDVDGGGDSGEGNAQLYKVPHKVDVFYADGKGSELSKVKMPEVLNNASFEITIQGSSTKNFKGKNLDLEVISGDDEYTAVYTPNYSNVTDSMSASEKNDCYRTFLPETRFTLKADIVDSSHSNNTSMGRFINDNTTKFNTRQKSQKYTPYIKNCLLGFPVQIYVEVTTPIPDINGEYDETNVEIKYYYLGIYNFNLGRDSWHNLGYVDLENSFENIDLLDGFQVYAIENTITKHDGLLVAEITGGSPYFDFSQYDKTILFELPELTTDNAAMFGDIVGRESSGINEQEQNVIQQFVKSIAQAGGYLFKNIGKNFGPITEKYHASVEGSPLDSKNQVPDWTQQYRRVFENQKNNYIPLPAGQGPDGEFLSVSEINHLIRAVKGGSTEEDAHIKPFIDYVSLVEYYTTCMVMGLVDSVQKNLNIKSWNANEKSNDTDTNATFYVAFYDMDTCLGLDNDGNSVAYFAFSDFWKSTVTKNGDISTPNAITIYRDFYPLSDSSDGNSVEVPTGFDIPSTYLFAIAKYAKIFDSTDVYGNTLLGLGNTYKSFPGNLYAQWRRKGGPLENAESFVNKYFANNLANVAECAINFNYRYKYLNIVNNSFDNTNMPKFKGTRIHKLIDWMNGRLHILDAYFNLSRIEADFQSYDIETNTWAQFMNENGKPVMEYLPGDSFIDKNNTDINILTDIFEISDENSTTSGQKYEGKVDVNVTAPDYTPLIVAGSGSSHRYLLEHSNETYKVSFETTGNEQYKLGGSKEWLTINNINTLITGRKQFSITSDKIEQLIGTSKTCEIWYINLPAVKNISLTSENYSGELNLSSGNNNGLGYPNINTINISNSKLSLFADKIPVSTITANNVNAETLYINECSKLTSVSFKNSSFTNVTITPIWKNNFVIDKNYGNIRSLTVSGKQNEEYTLEISDNANLTSITVSGKCTSIVIKNCPNLNRLQINATDITNGTHPELKKLHITNCNTVNTDSLFSLNTDETVRGLVDLQMFTNLKDISFNSTINILCVNLPNTPIELSSNCFYNTGVRFLNTTNNSKVIIKGAGTFSNYNKFRPIRGTANPELNSETPIDEFFIPVLHNGNEQYINIELKDGITDLSNTFSNCSSLTTEDALWFVNTVCTNSANIGNITKVNSLFYGCNKITYTIKEFLEDYQNKTFKFNIKCFTNVVEATYMFYSCKFPGIHRYMLRGLGSNIYNDTEKSLNCATFCNVNSVTIDVLYDVIDYISTFPWNTPISVGTGTILNIIDIDASKQTLSSTPALKYVTDNIKLKDLIEYTNNPKIYVNATTEREPENDTNAFYISRLTSFDNFNVAGDVDYSDLFKEDVSYKINRIYFSFGVSTKMTDKYNTFHKIGVKHLNLLEFVYSSFNIDNANNNVDLFDLFGETVYKNIFACNTSSTSQPSNRTIKFGQYSGCNCMTFNKYVHYNKLRRIFELAIQYNTSISRLENLFKNCYIGVPDAGTNELNLIYTDSGGNKLYLENCISINNLFTNIKFIIVDREEMDNAGINYYIQQNKTTKVIPIKLSTNSTYIFKNCQNYANTFSYLTISENLPFDFFNKRRLNTPSRVYVREYDYSTTYHYYTLEKEVDKYITNPDGSTTPIYKDVWVEQPETYYYSTEHTATKYTYDYNTDVDDLSNCFAYTTISNIYNNYTFDKSTIIDSNGAIKISYDYIIRDDNNTYSNAYTDTHKDYNATNIKFSYVVMNTEIEDCMNIKGLHKNKIDLIYKTGSDEKLVMQGVNNFYINDEVLLEQISSTIVPPDILYCVNSAKANITGMFNNFNGIGILPKHLLKKCADALITNTFNNNFVIPQLYCTVNVDEFNLNEIYVYVPESFTKATNLNNSFNFKFNLPQGSHKSDRLYGTEKTKHSVVYMFTDTSIPSSFTSMEYGLPQYYRSLLNTNHTCETGYSISGLYNKYNFGIKFNLMCKPIYNNGIVEEIEEGLDMRKFTNFCTNMSNFIPTQMMQILNGKLFNEDFDIGTAGTKSGAYIMRVESISSSNTQLDDLSTINVAWASISKNIILPRMARANTNVLYIAQFHSATLATENVIEPDVSIKNYTNNSIIGGEGTLKIS